MTSDLYMMIRFLFCLLLTAGVSQGVQVDQSPAALIRKAGDAVQLVCTHGEADYNVMLWYRQSPGDQALKLIGHIYSHLHDVEGAFIKHFKLAGDLSGDGKNGSLSIINLKAPKHTATYFCAASEPQYVNLPSALYKNLFPLFSSGSRSKLSPVSFVVWLIC
uniref:Immunoglobulin V-set domain-containing protein n=1 Tax=Scophthalmus maximus TaxID=52904 RepID=A0A8D3EDU1_SCOMX